VSALVSAPDRVSGTHTHGQAADGDGLITQLNTPAGSPPFWFTAVFLTP
jgi:hypothetical protein